MLDGKPPEVRVDSTKEMCVFRGATARLNHDGQVPRFESGCNEDEEFYLPK